MMSQASGSRPTGPGQDPGPQKRVPGLRPGETAADADARMADAVQALERVRTQLARTQRTLDAFVDQIVGAADAATEGGLDREASTGHAVPPASLADHVITNDPPTDGPAR